MQNALAHTVSWTSCTLWTLVGLQQEGLCKQPDRPAFGIKLGLRLRASVDAIQFCRQQYMQFLL